MSGLRAPGPDPRSGSGEEDDLPEPASVRRLRWLVSALMIVLIAGMITVAATLVIRLGGLDGRGAAPGPIAAERVRLPEGHEVLALGARGADIMAFTRAPDGTERLLLIDGATGEVLSTAAVERTGR